ncbi:MAG: hypothetical protein ABIS07_08355, partial [Dokdonella sp.]
MTLADRVDVSAGRAAAGDRAGVAGLRANEGTLAASSAGSLSLRGGLRCGGTGVDADDVAIGGFGIGFCAGVAGDAKAGAGRVACA